MKNAVENVAVKFHVRQLATLQFITSLFFDPTCNKNFDFRDHYVKQKCNITQIQHKL